MAQDPWDNVPVVSPPRQRQAVTVNGQRYGVVRSAYTTETPEELAAQGYTLDPATGSYAKTVGQVEVTPQGQAPWENVPVAQDLTPSQYAAQAEAERRLGTNGDAAARESQLFQGLTFGLADEAAGRLAEVGQMGRNALRNLNGQPIEIQSRDLRDAVTNYSRQQNETFQSQRPLESLALQFAGGALSGGLAGGGRATLANAARTGLVTGAAYGAGTAEGGFAERLAPAALGGAIGAAGGVALQSAVSPLVSRLAGISSASTASAVSPVAERVAASRWAGIDPTLAGTGGPVTRRVAQTLAGNVAGSGPMAAASSRAREQTIAAVDRIAGQYGSAGGRDSAGQVLRRGAQAGAQELRTETGTLYQPVNVLEQNTTPIPLNNARQAVDESLSVFTTPELRDWFTRNATDLTQFQNVLSNAENATFAEARQLRSIVGSMLNDPTVFNSRSQAGLRRLYGALSEDITQGAQTLGGPQAAQALGRADQFYAAARERADRVLEPFLGADNASTAFDRLLGLARSTGRRSDWAQLRQLRQSIPEGDWNEVGAGVIRALGGEGDSFSPSKFVTEWDKLTPQARRTLFGGSGREAEFRDLNNLARVMRDQKTAGQFYNYSESGNTAGNLAGFGAVAAAGGAAATGNFIPAVALITGAGLMNGASRLLTSPGVARWLAQPASRAAASAPRLAARNADFAVFWNANRQAIANALQQTTAGPVRALAGDQTE